MDKWKRLESEVVSDNRAFRLRRDLVINPRNELTMDAYVLECRDWVNIIALTTEEELVLVRQFRHGIAKETLEIPGGVIDDGEDPAEAAERELLEETGYEADELRHLGTVDAQPAIQNNRLHTYLACGARKVSTPSPDSGEDLNVELRPYSTLHEMVRKGEISHSMMLTAFYWLGRHIDENGGL